MHRIQLTNTGWECSCGETGTTVTWFIGDREARKHGKAHATETAIILPRAETKMPSTRLKNEPGIRAAWFR